MRPYFLLNYPLDDVSVRWFKFVHAADDDAKQSKAPIPMECNMLKKIILTYYLIHLSISRKPTILVLGTIKQAICNSLLDPTLDKPV